MQTWLAIYVDKNGNPRTAMLLNAEVGSIPFGVDEFALGLADYDGEPVTLIEMPTEPGFRPMVVDVTSDTELPMDFIDLTTVTVPDDD